MNKNRGLLLDRDGVINADNGYVGSWERFQFLPGLFPFLREARDLGFRLAILTNQSGVARGLYSEQDYQSLTERMLSVLRKEDITIDLVLASFTHPEGVRPSLSRDSFWRKPNPGMLWEAVRLLHLDPHRSAFVGDKISDMQAAEAAQIKDRFLLNGEKSLESSSQFRVVRNYVEILKALSV